VSTDPHLLDISGIAVEVVRKEIKHLHVGVYPPHGRVRVAAPVRLDDEALRLAVVSRLGWIRRKQKAFEGQHRQSKREMISGESHYFRGRRYRLHVIDAQERSSVRVVGLRMMELRVRRGSDRHRREQLLQRWYRRRLREQIPSLLAKWEPRVGQAVADVRIKRMKTLWGSCNADARRIWLNLELVKKPVSCLEYILVHEMVHLSERHHNERFEARMDAVMPSWRERRAELNREPLAHEDWTY
jgi:predicted metal-dependent hydrolase